MPYLTVTTEKGTQLTYPLSLDEQTLVVGNDPDCDVYLPDKTLTPDYGSIKRVKGGYYLALTRPETDVIVVNGFERTGCNLSPIAPITIGGCIMNIIMSDEEITYFETEKKTKTVEASAVVDPTPANEPQDITLQPADPPTIVQTEATPTPIAVTPIETTPAPKRMTPPPPRAGAAIGTPGARPGYVPAKRKAGFPTGYIMTLLILCVVGVFIGMFVRHYKTTSRLLTDDIMGIDNSVKTPPPVTIKKPVEITKVEPVKKDEDKPITKPMVISEQDATPQTDEAAEPTIDKAVKSKGKMKLPTLDEFLIP